MDFKNRNVTEQATAKKKKEKKKAQPKSLNACGRLNRMLQKDHKHRV